MKETFYGQYNTFKNNAEGKNSGILLDYENDKIDFFSKQTLSLIVSECLIEDIDTIQYLKDGNCSKRYIDIIIRNMCEQVIEYLYIMKNQELIPTYFGGNIKECDDQKDLFKVIKQTGKARFGRRQSVNKMAEDIGEVTSSDDKIALYDIFSMKAELEHNSYFYEILHVLGEMEDAESKKSVEELDYIFLIYVLSAFEKAYYAA